MILAALVAVANCATYYTISDTLKVRAPSSTHTHTHTHTILARTHHTLTHSLSRAAPTHTHEYTHTHTHTHTHAHKPAQMGSWPQQRFSFEFKQDALDTGSIHKDCVMDTRTNTKRRDASKLNQARKTLMRAGFNTRQNESLPDTVRTT